MQCRKRAKNPISPVWFFNYNKHAVICSESTVRVSGSNPMLGGKFSEVSKCCNELFSPIQYKKLGSFGGIKQLDERFGWPPSSSFALLAHGFE